MTTENAPQPPLTPAAIQNADAGLNAYLQARACDFEAHGWKDADGLIETRDGRALLASHIDITLRRARAAERDRNARTLEAAGLRSLLEDVATTVAQCREIGRPYGGDPLWSTVIARCDAILARVAAVIPETVAETAQPGAGRPTAASRRRRSHRTPVRRHRGRPRPSRHLNIYRATPGNSPHPRRGSRPTPRPGSRHPATSAPTSSTTVGRAATPSSTAGAA